MRDRWPEHMGQYDGGIGLGLGQPSGRAEPPSEPPDGLLCRWTCRTEGLAVVSCMPEQKQRISMVCRMGGRRTEGRADSIP